MRYESFSKKKVMHHELTGGFALDSAPERAFGVHYAVYRRENPTFYRTFLDEAAALPGVTAVGMSGDLHLNTMTNMIAPPMITLRFRASRDQVLTERADADAAAAESTSISVLSVNSESLDRAGSRPDRLPD